MPPTTLSEYAHLKAVDENALGTILLVKALANARGPHEAMQMFAASAPASQVRRHEKSATDALTTTGDPSLANARLHLDFLRVVAPRTILEQLAGSWRPVPLTTMTPIVSDDAVADFVPQNAPIPATGLTTDQLAFMTLMKLAVIVGISRELSASMDPRAVDLIGGLLKKPIRAGEDAALLSADTRVEGERPAGLLAGLSPVAGSSPASLADDLSALWAAVRDGQPVKPTFIASARGAFYLSLLREEGTPTFPNATPVGGTISGVPLVISAAATNKLVLLDASCLGVSDNGLILDATQHATLMLDTAAADNAGQVLTSAFGQNMAFIKLTRYVDWTLGCDDAVAYLELPISA